MSIKERLLLYLDNQGITKYAFYKKTNLGNGYLDKTNEPHIDKINHN